MFTGLIQCIGDVLTLTRTGQEARFVIRPRIALESPCVGESIAVNGACLTAESFSGGTFTAYASMETLTRSTLGSLSTGSQVNLEQALRLSTRLGGHLVSGHVDATATVASVTPAGDSVRYRLSFPSELAAQVIPKGSVTLDGVSLTVNACGNDFLEVNIIPETRSATTVRNWKAGTLVNMETDLIGKYVVRMLELRRNGTVSSSGLTMDFLREHGF